jgi:hypothetical protein
VSACVCTFVSVMFVGPCSAVNLAMVLNSLRDLCQQFNAHAHPNTHIYAHTHTFTHMRNRYIHNADWDAAMRVAEAYDPPSMPDIMLAQAAAAAEAQHHQVGACVLCQLVFMMVFVCVCAHVCKPVAIE